MKISFSPMGDTAVVIDFSEEISHENNLHILAWKRAVEKAGIPGFVEAIPAFTTLTVIYDPNAIHAEFPYRHVLESIKSLERDVSGQTVSSNPRKVIEIPVCYEPPFSPDLAYVAAHAGRSPEEVIKLHTQPLYDVYFLGFSPGFPFMAGLDERIHTPRRNTPRLKVEKGAVGIAGGQTGVYPYRSPGGWQIIGRTPLTLFQPDKESPSLIAPGDQIRFVPIDKDEFFRWEAFQ